jgi:hypothetical protein
MCCSGVGFADVSKPRHNGFMNGASSKTEVARVCGVLGLELLYFQNYER